MPAHHPAPTRTARIGHAEPDNAEVREIYPGASAARPFRERRPGKLSGSEDGMATAEYAIATLGAVSLRTQETLRFDPLPSPGRR